MTSLFARFGAAGALSLTLLMVGVPQAAAQEAIELRSRIDRVTVFPGEARVRRVARVSLTGGAAGLVFRGLPANLLAESLRVEPLAGAGLKIGSVEARQEFLSVAANSEVRRLERELERLQDQSRTLEDRKAAAQLQLRFLELLTREVPDTMKRDLLQGTSDPEALRAMVTLLGEEGTSALQAVATAEAGQAEIAKEIERLQRELGRLRAGQRASTTVTVELESVAAGEGEVALSYQLPGASWRPLYDARLDSASGRFELTQLAEVRQATGEDWSDVELVLSTARPGLGAALPDLQTWFIDLLRPVEKERRVLGQLQSNFEDGKGDLAEVLAPAPAAEPEEIFGGAELVASEFAAEYRIPGRVAVPADDAAHSYRISRQELPVELEVRTAPKLLAQAFLAGTVTHEGEAPLLPGDLAVFRDGTFVGRGVLPALRPGETADLSFGVDERVRVDYRLAEGERSSGGILNREQRHQRHYRIEVANHHGQAMTITVFDQLPVPRDERIEVTLLDDSTRPTERDYRDRKGVLAWSERYEPGESRIVTFAYEVRFPEDAAVAGF